MLLKFDCQRQLVKVVIPVFCGEFVVVCVL